MLMKKKQICIELGVVGIFEMTSPGGSHHGTTDDRIVYIDDVMTLMRSESEEEELTSSEPNGCRRFLLLVHGTFSKYMTVRLKLLPTRVRDSTH